MITVDETKPIIKNQLQLNTEKYELSKNDEQPQHYLCDLREIKKYISDRILAAAEAGYNYVEIKKDDSTNSYNRELFKKISTIHCSLKYNNFDVELNYDDYKELQSITISFNENHPDNEYVDLDLISVSKLYELLKQKRIKHLHNQYQQKYEQRKLEYDIARIFIYKMPCWKYVVRFFLVIYFFYAINLLAYTIANNNGVIAILFLSLFKIVSNFIIMLILTYLITMPIMRLIKPNKKYFDAVITEIDKKFQSNSIIKLEESNRTPEVKDVVTKFLKQIQNTDAIIYYKDIYDLYKKSEEDLEIAERDLKNVNNEVNELIKKQKQKENIQEYIKEYMQETRF